MARLYNGIDGLGLGRSVNDLWNQQYLQRKQNMDSFANGMTQLMQGLGEQREQARQKQSAIDFLTRNGMTAEDAQSLANSGLASGELTKYMLGRLDKIEDLKAANARADFEYGRAREDKLNDEEWNREMDDLGKMQDSHDQRKKEIEDKEFNALNTRYQLLLSKQQSGVLMSDAEVAELNQVKEQLDKWLWKHPDYTQMNIDYGNAAGNAAQWTTGKATDALNGLVEKDGKVDPAKLKALDEKYLRETGRTLAKDLPDLYKNIAQKQRGSRGKRNADNPNSGNITTEEDYKKAWDNEQEAARLSKLAKGVEEALIRGGQYPDLTEKDIKKLEYKYPSMMGQYKRIMMRKGR